MGIFAGKGQFKAAHHVHSLTSQIIGGDMSATEPLWSVIERHYALDYDILCITDHNYVTRHWLTSPDPPSQQRFDEIAAGVGRGGRGMLMIPDCIEQTGMDHINTFLMNFAGWWNTEWLLSETGLRGGLAHFNHIGRTIGGVSQVNNPTHIARYADLFLRHRALIGMEIINAPRSYGEMGDRRIWDNILAVTIPQGKYVWGFSNDDTHDNTGTGFSFNVMVMPELSVRAFTNAMRFGDFYAVSRRADNEGVFSSNLDAVTPVIRDIEITPSGLTITAENHHSIDWMTDGHQRIAQGNAIDLSSVNVGSYVRVNILGPTGIAFSQPFRIENGKVVPPLSPTPLAWAVAPDFSR